MSIVGSNGRKVHLKICKNMHKYVKYVKIL